MLIVKKLLQNLNEWNRTKDARLHWRFIYLLMRRLCNR